ncbi:MAG: translation elongation factor Ts [Rhodospirillaceae bacterium]|nr:translation elongation factor Ts [Rhodospirillaceae bacterium]MDD9998622.1 translation elongation factor Ts [Rhodospirillaceae bacterium]MDE0363237.1 translation elongation factor Ts [Rhodospirillaceae bacterium]
MPITAALVKQLRERTGAGMMDCKRALTEVDGDLDRAADFLRKAGQAKADRKAARVAAQGLVLLREDAQGSRCVVLEINCETDFVAKDENFVRFAESLAELVLSREPADVEELLAMETEGESVEALRRQLVAKVGENISVRRFELVSSSDVLGAYSHHGRIGTLVETRGGSMDLARDLAMQVAAMSPRYVGWDDIPEAELAKEREILAVQAEKEGKPPHIVSKMVEGRLRKQFDAVTLTSQAFVKDPDKRVRDLLAQSGASVLRFLRYEVGEGIERREVDFVKEVREQASRN